MSDDLDALAAAVDEATEETPSPGIPSTSAEAPLKRPSDYAGSDTAATINALVGSLTGEPDLVAKVRLGESACATLESAGLDSRIAPHFWLFGGVLAVAAVVLWKRRTQPNPMAPPPLERGPRNPEVSDGTPA